MPLTQSQRADFSRLVKAHPVLLFMKGNRQAPACGFSATVVGILNEFIPSFQTIDILQDPSMREGMKEFSSWPTFPQLYVRGEFVGGCDIVKEIYASGELQKLLGAEGASEAAPAEEARMALIVTSAAARAFSDALGGSTAEVVRLEIDPEYKNDLHIAPKNDGDVAAGSGGMVLYVGASSARRAEGITIDFVNTPDGMAFKIDNPNAPAAVKRLLPKELKAMLDRGPVQLFDVRPAGERALAFIAGAKPFDEQEQREMASLARSTPIVVHCHHGVRSRFAAERLIAEGFTNVYNLEGGIEAWSRDVDPAIARY
jgi:monothiol glutaredoxin